MRPLRHLSARPELVVDEHGHRLVDPATNAFVGKSGPWGRERVVYALPLNGMANTQPGFQLAPPAVLVDHHGNYIADPAGVLVGVAGIRVNRMLAARWTEDTRRL